MTYWTWLVAGLVMLAIELLAPMAFFLWLGVSAFVTGLVVLLIPELAWQSQLLIFSVLSVSGIVISRRYLVRRQTHSEAPDLNQRAQQYVGRIVVLSEPIRQGMGKVVVDDSRWQVTGPRLEKGTEVRITHVRGSVFTVEEADPLKNT